MAANPKREVTGDIGLREFANAMQKGEFDKIEDPQARKKAVAERFRKIMEATVHNPDDVAYLKSENAKASMRAKGWQV